MRKLWMVAAVLVIGLSVVAVAECPRVYLLMNPTEEIDGTKPFYVSHGWGIMSAEDFKESGYRGPRDAAEQLGFGFELYVDGNKIEPTHSRPVRTRYSEIGFWDFHWFFRFQPGDLTPGVHEFTGRWFRSGFEMSFLREILVL